MKKAYRRDKFKYCNNAAMRVSVLLLSESVQEKEEEDSEIKMKYIAMAVEIKSFKCATTARFMRLFPLSFFLTFQFNPYAATQLHYVLRMKNTFFYCFCCYFSCFIRLQFLST